jgi:hypothetical protein
MSQQSVGRQRGGRRWAQLARRRRAERARPLDGLAVDVLVAVGERDAAIRRLARAGQALLVMTVREAVIA